MERNKQLGWIASTAVAALTACGGSPAGPGDTGERANTAPTACVTVEVEVYQDHLALPQNRAWERKSGLENSSPRDPDRARLLHLQASCSEDAEDTLDALEFRWDFEADGVWDTDWRRSAEEYLTFSSDTRVIRLAVRDGQGLESVVDYRCCSDESAE